MSGAKGMNGFFFTYHIIILYCTKYKEHKKGTKGKRMRRLVIKILRTVGEAGKENERKKRRRRRHTYIHTYDTYVHTDYK